MQNDPFFTETKLLCARFNYVCIRVYLSQTRIKLDRELPHIHSLTKTYTYIYYIWRGNGELK
jgi:hypothetical protein